MHVIDTTQLEHGAEYEGRDYDSGSSIILVRTSRKGDGPALHQHPYSETFILQTGRAEFTVGDRKLVGNAGQVIIEPAYTPHKFANASDELLTMTNIHASDHFITEWL